MRGIIAVVMLICSVVASAAQSKDSNDRMLGIEMNRDKAENRIERLREDKVQTDKARADSTKKSVTKPKPTQRGKAGE